MLKATFKQYKFKFKRPSGTSRGVLTEKSSWFIKVWDNQFSEVFGIGECSPLHWLSIEPLDKMDEKLNELCARPDFYAENLHAQLVDFPSIRFGFEMALQELTCGGKGLLFESPFTAGKDFITINGLIWMGEKAYMLDQIENKLNEGFNCVKLKIGSLNFEDELNLIKHIRKRFSKNDVEIRVDANGAFSINEASVKLAQLAELDIHSIEQPIMPKQWDEMAALCANTPLPIALDEELIGVNGDDRAKLLDVVNPQYIILKPSLLGGFTSSEEWIKLAKTKQIGWWLTSALESNIGLNAIAQWAYTLKNPMPQGLGTGQLFINNIDSPLYLKGQQLWYNNQKPFASQHSIFD